MPPHWSPHSSPDSFLRSSPTWPSQSSDRNPLKCPPGPLAQNLSVASHPIALDVSLNSCAPPPLLQTPLPHTGLPCNHLLLTPRRATSLRSLLQCHLLRKVCADNPSSVTGAICLAIDPYLALVLFQHETACLFVFMASLTQTVSPTKGGSLSVLFNAGSPVPRQRLAHNWRLTNTCATDTQMTIPEGHGEGKAIKGKTDKPRNRGRSMLLVIVEVNNTTV